MYLFACLLFQDADNPPPKTIKGYKFNIFYPDLVDHTETPQYFLSPDPSGNEEFCIIRFHAGPPYEVLVFFITVSGYCIQNSEQTMESSQEKHWVQTCI